MISMKLITLSVTDEEHKRIKLAATQKGITIKTYLLNNLISTNIDAVKAVKELPMKVKADKKHVVKFCEHGQVKGLCEWKGCKFGRFRK